MQCEAELCRTDRVSDDTVAQIATHLRALHRLGEQSPMLSLGEALRYVNVDIVPAMPDKLGDGVEVSTLSTDERSLLECFTLLGESGNADPRPYTQDVLCSQAERLVGLETERVADVLRELCRKGYVSEMLYRRDGRMMTTFAVTAAGRRALGFGD
jgi:hypothetical protein